MSTAVVYTSLFLLLLAPIVQASNAGLRTLVAYNIICTSTHTDISGRMSVLVSKGGMTRQYHFSMTWFPYTIFMSASDYFKNSTHFQTHRYMRHNNYTQLQRPPSSLSFRTTTDFFVSFFSLWLHTYICTNWQVSVC